MYIAMNRFKIVPGKEQEFEQMWQNRESYLHEVAGFQSFRLLKGKSQDEFTLYASHAIWDDERFFNDWVKSDAFKKAHSGARSSRDMYLEGPRFEGFEVVLTK